MDRNNAVVKRIGKKERGKYVDIVRPIFQELVPIADSINKVHKESKTKSALYVYVNNPNKILSDSASNITRWEYENGPIIPNRPMFHRILATPSRELDELSAKKALKTLGLDQDGFSDRYLLELRKTKNRARTSGKKGLRTIVCIVVYILRDISGARISKYSTCQIISTLVSENGIDLSDDTIKTYVEFADSMNQALSNWKAGGLDFMMNFHKIFMAELVAINNEKKKYLPELVIEATREIDSFQDKMETVFGGK